MLLLELLLTTGLPLSQLFIVIFMDLLMIETGLIGSLVVSRYKWGKSTFAAHSSAPELTALLSHRLLRLRLRRRDLYLVDAPRSGSRVGGPPRLRLLQGLHALGVHPVLPLAPLPDCLGPLRGWQRHLGHLRDGLLVRPFFPPPSCFRARPTDSVFPSHSGVLDVLAKPVFSFIHVFAISKLDYARLGLSSGKVSDGAHQGLLAGDNKHATPRASTATGVNDGVVGDGRGFHPAGNTAV